ncbi:MAG: hypothetical protein HZY76_02020 [Anaerolineae bacterium]|nr:MAG: hypothetical protein HZY76_02020 [Anaerolineae bacterium]
MSGASWRAGQLYPGRRHRHPALRRIPSHERLLNFATNFNPSGRITTEPDVAITIAALADPTIQWISGSVITVDGAEDIVGA